MKWLSNRSQPQLSEGASAYWSSFGSVDGWFCEIDFILFDAIHRWQRHFGATGDVLEIGAAGGRSAILLGYFAGERERLIVCDTFPGYRGLGLPPAVRETFEKNFLRFHTRLPVILEGESSDMLSGVDSSSVRLIHVDGSHRYADVRTDLESARRLGTSEAVVIFDDFRWVTVAAALWPEIAHADLRPFLFSEAKMYATFGAEPDFVPVLTDELHRQPGMRVMDRSIFGYSVLEVSSSATRLEKVQRRAIEMARLLSSRRV